MLKTHLDYVEKLLIAQSEVVDEAGHSLHKGTPRESFIRDFLEDHISERAAFGTGEIIDVNSKPTESRNQIDIVIYRRDYPRLKLGGGISVFLAESVIATIEVKSTLTKTELKKSIKAASKIKQLERKIHGIAMGYVPPSIVSYVVAYDGPAKMETVYGWLGDLHHEIGIEIPQLTASREERKDVACPSVDGVFVLGKGFLYFDNTLTGYTSNPIHEKNPDAKWIYANSQDGNIYLLFIFLSDIVSSFLASFPRLTPYLTASNVKLQWGD